MFRLFPNRVSGGKAALLFFCLLGLAGCVTIDERTPEERFAQQVLITIEDSERMLANGFADQQDQAGTRPVGTVLIQDILKLHGLKKIAQWPIRSLGLHAVVAEFGKKTKLNDLLKALRGDKRVESVQAMHTYRVLSYNDPYFELQNAINSDRIETIHRLTTGKNVNVGIIDTGIDRQHPELSDRVVYSRNFVDHDQSRFDQDEHGTAVAGIIASSANNDLGIVGVAPEVNILSFKACWHDDVTRRASCDSFSLMKALVDVLEQQPDVVNLSLSGPDDPLIRRLLTEASERGIVLIAARDSTKERSFPATMRDVIAVGTPMQAGTMVEGILAPGTDVLTTTPGATYAFKSGSSMSTAYVTGVTALVLERQPMLSGLQVAEHLRNTSRVKVETVPVIDLCAAVGLRDDVCQDTAIASLSGGVSPD